MMGAAPRGVSMNEGGRWTFAALTWMEPAEGGTARRFWLLRLWALGCKLVQWCPSARISAAGFYVFEAGRLTLRVKPGAYAWGLARWSMGCPWFVARWWWA